MHGGGSGEYGGFGSPWADSQAGANNHRGGKLTQSSVDDEGGEVADLKDENNMPTPTHPVQSRVVRSCFKTGSHTSCTARQTTLVVMRSEHFTTLVTAETQTGFNGGGKTTSVAW